MHEEANGLGSTTHSRGHRLSPNLARLQDCEKSRLSISFFQISFHSILLLFQQCL